MSCHACRLLTGYSPAIHRLFTVCRRGLDRHDRLPSKSNARLLHVEGDEGKPASSTVIQPADGNECWVTALDAGTACWI